MVDLRWFVKRLVYTVWDDEVDAHVECHSNSKPVLQYQDNNQWLDVPVHIEESQ